MSALDQSLGVPRARAHETPNPHDAEEQLRGPLGVLWEAQHAQEQDDTGSTELLLEYRDAAMAALDAALGLLGVRR